MRAILLSLLMLCGSVAYCADPPLPPEAQKVLDDLDAAVAKLKAKAAADLQKVQDKETKAGHLEVAVAVKKVVEGLKPAATVAKVDPTGKYKVTSDSWPVTSLVLDDKGKVKASNGDSGSWVVEDGSLVITWYNGNTNKATYNQKSMLMSGDHGASFTISKE